MYFLRNFLFFVVSTYVFCIPQISRQIHPTFIIRVTKEKIHQKLNVQKKCYVGCITNKLINFFLTFIVH